MGLLPLQLSSFLGGSNGTARWKASKGGRGRNVTFALPSRDSYDGHRGADERQEGEEEEGEAGGEWRDSVRNGRSGGDVRDGERGWGVCVDERAGDDLDGLSYKVQYMLYFEHTKTCLLASLVTFNIVAPVSRFVTCTVL